MEKPGIIIIGGGISGLSMAHFCAGLNPLLLEKTARPGGALASTNFGGKTGDFWAELGAHSCFNSYGELIGILEAIGLLPEVAKRRKAPFKLWMNQQLRPIFSQLSLWELISNAPRIFKFMAGLKASAANDPRRGYSVREFFPTLFGASNYARVFSPAFDAVICQSSAEFPADMLFRPKPRRKDVPRGFTFAGGLQTIVDRMARNINCRVHAEVQSLCRDGTEFVAKLADGDEVRAARACLATPPAMAAKLLAEEFPAIAGLLRQLNTVTVESLGVAVKAAELKLPWVGGIIGCGEPFYSAVSRDTVAHSEYRGFSFHFKPGQSSETEKIHKICQVLGIERRQIVAMDSRINHLPAPRLGHADWVNALDHALAGLPLALTGNYFSGVSIEDCVLRSRQECERIRAMTEG